MNARRTTFTRQDLWEILLINNNNIFKKNSSLKGYNKDKYKVCMRSVYLRQLHLRSLVRNIYTLNPL